MGLGQLFEIKPRCCRGSLLRDELGLRRFETQNDLTYSFPRAPAGALGRLGSPNPTQAGRYFRGNLWPSAIGRKVMRIVHKPVALAWRQRASSALRARAAATLPPAFMNNSHDFCPTRTQRAPRELRACAWQAKLAVRSQILPQASLHRILKTHRLFDLRIPRTLRKNNLIRKPSTLVARLSEGSDFGLGLRSQGCFV
jgi:hypothetical protein